MQQLSNEKVEAAPGSELFNRQPRIWTLPPMETVHIPPLPQKDALPPTPGALTMVMPIVMVVMLVSVTILVSPSSLQQLAFFLPMALFTILTPLANLLSARQKIKATRRKWKETDEKYLQVLAKLRTHLTEQANIQRQVALAVDPDPEQLEERIKQRSHLWERRPNDPDFLAVRVGKGNRPFTVTLQIPDIDVTDPLAEDIQELKDQFISVADIPCTVSLTKVKSLGVTGRRQNVAALMRGILCQVATHHSPEDVRIFGIYPKSQQQDWEWMAELPHTMTLKAGKQDRLVAAGEDEANALLNVLLEELSQRASKNEGDGTTPPVSAISSQPSHLPHLVVIVHDYVEVRKHPALTHAFKLGEQLGVSVIYMVAQQQAIPSECGAVVRLFDDGLVNYAAAGFAGETFEEVYADTVELKIAQKVAHAFLPLHVAQGGEDAIDLPTNVRFLDLVGLPYADQLDVEQWWSTPPFGRLRVPIGMGADGPLWIDLNEAAHGPHGIIAGTTGAGKSELLCSLIVGLAITHHPHLVNFVLVDFKGGAAFKPFEKIPHTVGMVTDLSGHLTERALTALKSELRRREHILSSANVKKISEYQATREQNPLARMEPLPNLFIIIDEFAELAKEHPTFMEGLVSVVQKGRSLGVHLILATQKPTGSVNPNIWSNLKFRICLRVASLQDSRDMLGRSEAALLPSTIPGRAYFQIGSEIFQLFQSARISLPAHVADESLLALKQESAGAGEVTDQKVLTDALESYTAIGKELFRPWPDPLPHRVSLAELFRRTGIPSRGSKQPPYGWLTCPVGLIDLPADQKQEPWLLDMPRQGGHLMIAGASGTGKSVFLRTLITSLIQTHSPLQLHLYLIDFGGQALRIFEKLPHVGGVFGEADEEYIRRLLRKLDGIIEERKQFCMTNQIEDFLTYQRRRAENDDLPEMPAVVLVIDKFTEFKQVHEKEMDTLLAIARYGRTYGVYIVLTLDRPVAVSTQLLSLFELRISLRLVELTDSLIFIGKHDAAHLDLAMPGRGYKRGKILEEVQIALPVSGEDDDEQNQQLDELVNALAKAGKDMHLPQAPPIRLLPEYVGADFFLTDAISNVQQGQHENHGKPEVLSSLENSGDLPDCQASMAQSPRMRLGIEDFSLSPILVELNADTPHMLVAGGPGSGKTSVLHTCLLMLASMPENKHARVILLDFRRSSRILRRLPNIWMHADNEEGLIETINTLKTELRERVARLREELERQEDDDEPIGTHEVPIVLIIDDYEQFSVLTKNPLNDLKEFMLQARDLRLHIIVTGGPGDLGRGDMILQQVRACRMGVILGADPQEQALLGVRMSDMPPGRGYVVRRNKRYLVQVAHFDTKTMLPWLTRLRQSRQSPQSLPHPPAMPELVPPSQDQQLLEEARRITDTTLAGPP
ncbi:MAG: type VII secretion protein EssC [Ktedonobacteraceae bacterium]